MAPWLPAAIAAIKASSAVAPTKPSLVVDLNADDSVFRIVASPPRHDMATWTVVNYQLPVSLNLRSPGKWFHGLPELFRLHCGQETIAGSLGRMFRGPPVRRNNEGNWRCD